MLSSSVRPSHVWQGSYGFHADDKEDSRETVGSNRPPKRRTSWMHNLSSKIAGHSYGPYSESNIYESKNAKKTPTQQSEDKSLSQTNVCSTPIERDSLSPQSSSEYAPSTSVIQETSASDTFGEPTKTKFFNTLRRLSSSRGSTNSAKECRRIVYNKNQNRRICPLEELKNMKMKRVAFQVIGIEDEVLDKEPLYSRIRNAVKAQRELIEKRKLLICLQQQCDRESLSGLEGYKVSDLKMPTNSQQIPKSLGLIMDGIVAPPKTSASPPKSAPVGEADCESLSSCSSNSSNMSSVSSDIEVPLITDFGALFARCCKLREIRPSPAIYNQIKNCSGSIDTLKFPNLQPRSEAAFTAQIDAFADFLTIVPVENILAEDITELQDNHVKAVVASQLNSTSLKFLSIKNSNVGSIGWKTICYLVVMNDSLEKLDVTGARRKPFEWNILCRAVEARNTPMEVNLTNTDASSQIQQRIYECSKQA
ncbi:hypothetical protein V1511DRAFT_232436 [Dipodascopsis uninucleata]